MNCPKCDGTGYIDYAENCFVNGLIICKFCKGKRTVNWIENIFGVQDVGIIVMGKQKTSYLRK